MNVRRVLAVVVTALAAVGLVAVDRHHPSGAAAIYGTDTQPSMPEAAGSDALTSSWYCPGVPASAETGSGVVSILNPSDSALSTTVTLVPSGGQPVVTQVMVPERSRKDLSVNQMAPGAYVAALVELLGSRAEVEQTVTTPAGYSVTPCSNAPSPVWYAADGRTTVNSHETLLVFNPFPDEAVVDLAFFEGRERTPSNFKGLPIPALSLRVIPIDETVRRKDLVSVTATARTGRVVLGRVLTFAETDRSGLVAGLATPAGQKSWRFPNGRKGADASERIAIYNPTDVDAQVTVTLFPSDGSAKIITLPDVVVSRSNKLIDLAVSAAVPEGDFSVVVSSDQAVVAERVLDLVGARATTTGQFGSVLASPRWYVPVTAAAGGSTTVVISSVSAEPASVNVAVRAIGPAGAVDVADLAKLVVPAGGTIKAVVPAGVAGLPLVVDADAPVVVERLLIPPGAQPGASASLGIPVT